VIGSPFANLRNSPTEDSMPRCHGLAHAKFIFFGAAVGG
jgi:hypothetical protein